MSESAETKEFEASDVIVLRVRNTTSALQEVQEAILAAAKEHFGEARNFNIRLALEETFINAVIHGNVLEFDSSAMSIEDETVAIPETKEELHTVTIRDPELNAQLQDEGILVTDGKRIQKPVDEFAKDVHDPRKEVVVGYQFFRDPHKGRTLRVEIANQACEVNLDFDPFNQPDPTLPENLVKGHGRGELLTCHFVNYVRWKREAQGQPFTRQALLFHMDQPTDAIEDRRRESESGEPWLIETHQPVPVGGLVKQTLEEIEKQSSSQARRALEGGQASVSSSPNTSVGVTKMHGTQLAPAQ